MQIRGWRRRGRPARWGFDELCLRAQNGLDRLIRRLRLGPAPLPGRRRFLVVQIDGLSRTVLDEALARGDMPCLRRLLGGDGYRLRPMSVGLPTSTPAFQMAAMYGVRPDIPGFHYHDKRRRTDIHFPRPGHAAFVEADQAGTRRGILAGGGSVYGGVFTGGATHDFFSFARLTRPRARGLIRVVSAFVVVAWVAVKCVALTWRELAHTVGSGLRHPRRWGAEWKWLKKRILISVWTREWFTFAVARDVYDGVPGVWVNFLDHDETAHAFGPRSRQAFAALRRIDASLRQLRRVLRRVPGRRYDLYVLADHGQVSCTPYRAVTGGRRFEHAFFDQVSGDTAAASPERPAPDHPGVEPGFAAHLDDRESCERDGIRVVSAGPNAFVYFVDTPEPLLFDAIEMRWPGLCAALSKDPGVGFVLARGATGPVCFWRGERYGLEDADHGPFATREDWEIVARDIAALMAMPSAGDLVVYGHGAPEGHVSYIDEVGAHAGPWPEELHAFLVAPVDAPLPDRIDHPIELYDVFIRYHRPPRRRGRAPRLVFRRHPVAAATGL